ncbi:hypothetical protein JV46_26040 [Solemya velum gill symbiont]|uniref:Rv2993c-like N-terminal domain-containing protein n=1 Tax=Solemya velum gill symbiont TaxID=2340 RepID=A0A0B0H4R2_SOVGS|nr:DUF2437 domain-containing protein [Solemya velum gill symbiont]KHF24130.1 hypothetical protein JV46_26040 [Solemya velum gill symbiont]
MTKWVRIEHEGKATYGQLKGDTINLCTGSPFENNTMNGESVRLDHAKLLSPVEPRQFLGLWNNFHERRVADDLFMPKSPLFFVKLASCVSANDDTISRPLVTPTTSSSKPNWALSSASQHFRSLLQMLMTTSLAIPA